ncbi:MAG: YigZ family protein [Chloroflexota bacterium]
MAKFDDTTRFHSFEPIPVPAEERRVQITVVNSRFIAIAAPAFSVEEARQFIQRIRNEFPDATHHVPAYLIGYGSTTIEHCNDDGEPAGTAGKPILSVLKGSGIGNIVLVVVRYFGGTKLGTGGLVKAYQQAARAVIAELPLAHQIRVCEVECEIAYSDFQKVKWLIEKHEGVVVKEEYADKVKLRIQIPEGKVNTFGQMLRDATNGAAMMRIIEQELFVLRRFSNH